MTHPRVLFATLPRLTRPSRAANCALSLVCNTVRVTRNHAAIETTARYPPVVAGSALMPRTCGQQVAPTVLSETLFALPTTLSRMTPQRAPSGEQVALRTLSATLSATPAFLLRTTPQRGLAAGTARHPFLSRKGCKSDPRGAPLGYPPDGARCFPGSMGGDFSPNPGG